MVRPLTLHVRTSVWTRTTAIQSHRFVIASVALVASSLLPLPLFLCSSSFVASVSRNNVLDNVQTARRAIPVLANMSRRRGNPCRVVRCSRPMMRGRKRNYDVVAFGKRNPR